MKKVFYWLLPATLFTITSCHNNNSTESTSSDSTNSTAMAKDSNEQKFDTTNLKADANFAVEAADGGMLEVQLGQLAQTNASAADVKKLGTTMVEDHTKANDELKALAQKDSISIPAVLGDKSQKKYDELAKKTGNDFDKAYTDLMVSDHKDDIEAFQKEADKGNNPDLKNWASGKLSLLQHHLEMSKAANDKVKG